MKQELPQRLARGTIRLANWLVDGAVLAAVVLIVAFTAFAVLDNGRISDGAGVQAFAQYRPQADGASFQELQAENPDVLGWLTLYGTGIDYPLVQGKDNETYLNTDPAGNFALSGSLFLDWANARDFSDASTIVYGHHMENSLMFGDLDKYGDADFLDRHRTGNLYYGGVDHGIEVLGYLSTDAHDSMVYSTEVGKSPSFENFAAYLRSHATVWIEDPNPGERVVVLSTCGSGTNDRHIVVARISDRTFADPYPDEAGKTGVLADTAEGLRLGAQIALGLAVFLLIAWVIGGPRSGRGKKESKRV